MNITINIDERFQKIMNLNFIIFHKNFHNFFIVHFSARDIIFNSKFPNQPIKQPNTEHSSLRTILTKLKKFYFYREIFRTYLPFFYTHVDFEVE